MKYLCFCNRSLYISVIIKRSQYGHFIRFLHVRCFKKSQKFSSDSIEDTLLLLGQFSKFMKEFQIFPERILCRTVQTKLINSIIHVGEQFHPVRNFSQKLFYMIICTPNPFFYSLISSRHLLKQIHQPQIKIYHTPIREIQIFTEPFSRHSVQMQISAQKVRRLSRLLIIPNKIQHIQIFLSFTSAQTSTQLLEEHNRRFCRTQKHDHIYRSNIYTFIEHVHRKNYPYFTIFQFFNGSIPGFCIFSTRITVNCCRGDSSSRKFSRHILRMLPGAAKTQCSPGTIFHIIAVDQLIALLISNIGMVQILFPVTPSLRMKAGIIGLIKNSIIMKGNQHAFVDRILQGYFIWNIIITDFINVSAVHPLRRRRQPKQKLRRKISDDLSVLISYRMVELIHHNIVKIIFRKIITTQICIFSQRGYRSKNDRFVCILLPAVKKSVIIRFPYIPE